MMNLALLAQETLNLNPSGSNFGSLTGLTFNGLLSAGIQFLLIIAALVFFFMLVIGGIKWITSGGDKGKTEGARNQITAALVGLVIVFAAWAIIKLIEVFFNIQILSGLKLPTAGNQ